MREKLIYFIPNWEETSRLDEEKISFLSSYFYKQGIENKVLLTNFIPFLRYKLNEYGYNYEQVVRVFDILQNIKKDFGHPLSIEDIEIPKEFEKVFTPNSIILRTKIGTVGKVLYNEYGFISKVIYYTSNKNFMKYIYDDRGFLSQITYYEDNELIKIEYFNEIGDKTLTEFQDKIIVEVNGNNIFSRNEYSSINEMVNEILFNILNESHKKYLKENISVITTTEKKIINQTKNLEKYNVIRIVTEDYIDKEQVKVVVDTYQNQLKNKNSTLIPIFVPELMLGRSNYNHFQNIYCMVSKINLYEKKVITTMINKVVNDPNLSLNLELKNYESITQMKLIQTTIIEKSYGIKINSKEYKQVEEYIISKKENRVYRHMSEGIKELQNSSDWDNLVKAVEASTRINYSLFIDICSFENKLQDCRIYVDLEEKYNVLRHSKVVSRGIPIVTIHSSDYIILNKNGKKVDIESIEEIERVLDYYLYNLSNWNESLICCIELIKSFESDFIKNMWLGIL